MILALLLLLFTGCAMPLPASPPVVTPATAPIEMTCPQSEQETLVRDSTVDNCFLIPNSYAAESYEEFGSVVVRADNSAQQMASKGDAQL